MRTMRTATLLVTIPALLTAALPPFVEQVVPGVWAAGYGDNLKSANVAWYTTANATIVVGRAPTELDTAAVAKLTGKPVAAPAELPGLEKIGPSTYFQRATGVLFAGELVTNGPRATIPPGSAAWIAQLKQAAKLPIKMVIPGRGSWGGPELIERQLRFISELRRQVAYGIVMDRPLASIQQEILLPARFYTWMPYDVPLPEDVALIHSELTAPRAPFNGRRLDPSRKHALVLIGDRYHEPEHFEDGLGPAFAAIKGLEAHFTVDFRALTRENLAQVDLLVILRDGMVWPAGGQGPVRIWMNADQEKAVSEFVHGGKAFLNLHNSMGLYPAGGEYLKLVGGRYIGHGPLERFHVEVTDPKHPVAQGLKAWFAADEQHTPPNDIPVQIFLKSRSHDGRVVANAGWTHEPGKGRVCHLAPGHTRDALHHPMFQRALRNSIEWCLRLR